MGPDEATLQPEPQRCSPQQSKPVSIVGWIAQHEQSYGANDHDETKKNEAIDSIYLLNCRQDRVGGMTQVVCIVRT